MAHVRRLDTMYVVANVRANFLDAPLVRDGRHAWRIDHHRVDGSWASGDATAMQL